MLFVQTLHILLRYGMRVLAVTNRLPQFLVYSLHNMRTRFERLSFYKRSERSSAAGQCFEWATVKQDLQALQEAEIEEGDAKPKAGNREPGSRSFSTPWITALCSTYRFFMVLAF